LAIATYHSGKLYLPKSIREELKLSDGDRMEVTARGGNIVASPLRTQNPDELLLRWLQESPPRAKGPSTPMKPPWRRREIYARRG